jgi:hypothetical protein
VFKAAKELTVDGAGDCEKPWRVEVDRGHLRVLRDGRLFCEFCGLESRGGVPYAVGHRADEEERHGFGRMVMYEKRLLKASGCGVCVSSHVDYEKSTVEPILKSLRKTGFDMDRVVVVVDGDKRWEDWGDDRADKVRLVRANANAMGFAGLLGVSQGPEYWLLVHDTCEFERGFQDKLESIDVGLEPDVMLLFPPEDRNEMGLYSSRFLSSCGVDIHATQPRNLFGAFAKSARSVVVVPGKREVMVQKDVYGGGTKRKTVKIEAVSLKKYIGALARGGRP